MEKPKSLKWALANGFSIVGIQGTDHKFCEVSVFNPNPGIGNFRNAMFLISTNWLAKYHKETFYNIATPF